MWQKFKDYLLFGITLTALVLLILLMNKCEGNLPDNETTTKIEYKTDTIWPDTTKIYVFKDRKVPVPVLVTDTFYKIIDSVDCKRVYVYRDSLVDSNLVLYYKAHVQGVLRTFEPSYRLKIPLKIIDSIKVTKTIKIQPKFTLDASLIVSKGMIAPMGEVSLKRFRLGLGYNLNNKSPVISASYRLFQK